MSYTAVSSVAPVAFQQQGTKHTTEATLDNPSLADLQNLLADVNNSVSSSGTDRGQVSVVVREASPQLVFSWNTLP